MTAQPGARTHALPPLVIVSGMSGSGKSVALNTFEDLGYYCVDNLPAELLPEFIRRILASENAPEKIAVGIDARSLGDLADVPDALSQVGAQGLDPKLLFFDTRDDVLLRRYADTRRRHPLSHLGLALADAISLERQALKPLRRIADSVLDTSDLNVHQMRRHILTEYGLSGAGLSLLFESFAYRRGLPPEADFVLDARVLPNPHWDARLRPLSGRDADVRDYLQAQPEVAAYVAQVQGFLDAWLPKLRSETRSYVTVAFGCSGGRHRSVYLAERLARHCRETGWAEVAVHHRELD
jgi:RNase adapter protein RapZ